MPTPDSRASQPPPRIVLARPKPKARTAYDRETPPRVVRVTDQRLIPPMCARSLQWVLVSPQWMLVSPNGCSFPPNVCSGRSFVTDLDEAVLRAAARAVDEIAVVRRDEHRVLRVARPVVREVLPRRRGGRSPVAAVAASRGAVPIGIKCV